MSEISCIIPAYNESKNIGGVLSVVKDHPLIKEVIVVDDCSSDGTGDVVKALQQQGGKIRLITHTKNTGKSGAVYDGVMNSTGTHLFFLDADLEHVTAEDVTRLIEPVTSGVADVTISLRGNSPNVWRWIGLDYISGERVFPKKLMAENIEKFKSLSGFGLEVFMNDILITQNCRIKIVNWDNVSSPLKYKKYGWLTGIKGDVRMMRNIFAQVGVLGACIQIVRMRRLRVVNPAHDPSMTFVIPAHNEEAYVGGCLASILAELERGNHEAEIIVINNASTDHTEQVASEFPGVRVVTETQKGLTYARQRGFKEAHGEWIFNIDADLLMRPGWIRHVLNVIAADAKIVCVSGPHIYYDMKPAGRALIWLYWIFFAMPTYWMAGYMAQGGNFVVKKSAIETIGGFDTNIAFYGEDTNIARRLHKVGKVKFLLSCYNNASARRLEGQGTLTTVLQYAANFYSEALIKRPVTVTYKDFR